MSDSTTGRKFTLTADHLTLLRAAVVRWEDCEFGAPAIDCKRPYGNSGVLYDMAQLLHVAYDEDEGEFVNPDDEDRLRKIHSETETALQVILATGSFATGEYVAEPWYSKNWRLA